jgi:hypothetical protein
MLPANRIFLEVQYLKSGDYELNIVYKGKILLTVYFKIEL